MRGGAYLVLMLLLVGAKVLCFESSTLACPEEADECGTLVVPRANYPKRELNLSGLTRAEYGRFIAWLRDNLGSSEEIWALPVLRSRGSVPTSERFVLADITNYAGDTATMALDVINAYIVGYRVGNSSFFTRPEDDDTRDAIQNLFNGTERHYFSFTGSYGDLERAAGEGVSRETIELGAGALDAAVRTMVLYADQPTSTILHSVARGLIVCIEMISEAARFRYVEVEMKNRIDRDVNTVPDPSLISLENNWSALSDQIQTSYSDGVFQRPVQLQRHNYSRFDVSDIRTVLPVISVLLFHCQTPTKQQLPHHLAIPSATPTTTTRLVVTSDGDPTCPAHVESTWRIVGPDGLCVDVREENYDNGNPVQLWPCKSNEDQNQLWSFMNDGTIRSNGKCLASYGYTPKDYIMIYDCQPGVDAFTWHSWPNGTIASASGLVLSAHATAGGTTLSVRDNAYVTGQAWLPTNSTDPPVQQIAGVSELCLNSDGPEDVVLEKCDDEMRETSRWALYPDSSIRHDQRRDRCLAPPDTGDDHSLKLLRCDPNSSLQRWFFESDGTITSISTNLVMDVGGEAVSGAYLILNPWQGTDSQQWQARL